MSIVGVVKYSSNAGDVEKRRKQAKGLLLASLGLGKREIAVRLDCC